MITFDDIREDDNDNCLYKVADTFVKRTDGCFEKHTRCHKLSRFYKY